MKKNLLLFSVIVFTTINNVLAQIYTEPAFPTANDVVTVFYDASQGTAGLKDCNCDVYVHAGLITSASTGLSDWKYVKTQWGKTDPNWVMTSLGNNLYSWTVNIQQFYQPAAGEEILQMSFVFRNGAGTAEGKASGGKDIYTDVYNANSPFAAKLLSPANGTQLLKSKDETIVIKGAASKTSNLTITDNGVSVKAVANAKDINHTITVADENDHTVVFTAKNGTEEATQTFKYTGVKPVVVQDPPASLKLGANFNQNGSMSFMLYAPGKKNVYLVGDFNNYDLNPAYLMKRSVDGKYWWIALDNITNGTHSYQYVVDGTLRVADPHSELILDPNNDKYISSATYPNLPAYPTKGQGYVSSFEYPKKKFTWSPFTRPSKGDLVIYELLIRDFTVERNFQSIIDTLSYLKKLGINAIEFMPINEFDGNLSWGYNPTFHGALDKYYGSPEKFKELVEICHKNGIAVILDVVFNHISEKSPLIQMYPVSSGAYVNAIAKHDYNVFLDFNHETEGTKAYTDRCLEYWLEEYNIDGYRFDLSKGFTQKNTLGSVGAWGQYDQSRINILKHYNDIIKNTSGDAYHILEHFADSGEEKELSKLGMMVWGNFNYDYGEIALGYNKGSIGNSFYPKKGFTEPNLIAYAESHDEERIMYKVNQFGANAGSYNIKDLPTGLRRMELDYLFFYAIPGAKMLWQFGELGYDYSINQCQSGGISNNCRLDLKPVRWDYLEDKDRKRLYEVTASLINLKTKHNAFEDTDPTIFAVGPTKFIYLTGTDMDVVALGNFDVNGQTLTPNFYKTGKWYDYFTGETITVVNGDDPIFLKPGEYHLYTTKKLAPPIGGYKPYQLTNDKGIDMVNDFKIFPNPSASNVEMSYSITNPSAVKLEIFDLVGRKIDEPINEKYNVGSYNILLPKLDAGTYFAKLTVNQTSTTKKFIRLK